MRSDLFSAVIDRIQPAQSCLTAFSAATKNIPTEFRRTWTSWSFRRTCRACRLCWPKAAQRCGARVLQAIQHETSACYFVLAKDDGRNVGFLNPDCCSDYRRRGRLWLRADATLAARRPFKNFYVPVGPGRIHLLLDQEGLEAIDATPNQLRRLHGLYQRAPQDCGDWLHRFWPAQTADAIKRALVEQDLSWFASNRESLLSELEASRPVGAPACSFRIQAARVRRSR